MNPPKLIKPYVLTFCKSISKTEPCWVPLQPLPGKSQKDCVNIVSDKVALSGGRQILGWAIWEWHNVLIEAEFHAIWESPDGRLVDLTPRPFKIPQILFLPDVKIRYHGLQIDNHRKSLSKNKDVDRFIWLAEQMMLETNKGELANYYGKITLTGELLEINNEMRLIQDRLSRKYGSRF